MAIAFVILFVVLVFGGLYLVLSNLDKTQRINGMAHSLESYRKSRGGMFQAIGDQRKEIDKLRKGLAEGEALAEKLGKEKADLQREVGILQDAYYLCSTDKHGVEAKLEAAMTAVMSAKAEAEGLQDRADKLTLALDACHARVREADEASTLMGERLRETAGQVSECYETVSQIARLVEPHH